jgi:sugar phosphate isomerase/epimerase
VHAAPTPAISLAGLPRDAAPWATPRDAISWVRALPARAIVLDAARPGLRPRELGGSARRDLAALLRRSELLLAGLDLFPPPEHLADAAHADRAVEALTQAIGLAAYLAAATGDPPLLTTRLGDAAPEAIVRELASAAERRGVTLADAAWPASAHARVALDPAAVLAAGSDPCAEAARHAERLAAARLSDLGPAGRVVAGSARLDLPAYAASLAISPLRTVTIDLSHLRDPASAATATIAAWHDATALPNA